jgi:hypothetical protein
MECIYILKDKRLNNLCIDTRYIFNIYGQWILIYNYDDTNNKPLNKMSFDRFKKSFSYLKDSHGRIVI